ncbi:hypothetical protein BU17DRAFT_64223 [Hysterangium stoloniferum]|nr:hypothetical protein BU17DRAFT_64223 [Hysterangium stoloniferum]
MEYHPHNSPFSPTRNPDNPSAIQTFCNLLSSCVCHCRDEHFVASVTIYKQNKSKGLHEFVATEVVGPQQFRVFLIVERTPGRASSFDTVRTASSQNFVAAKDTIISLDRPTFAKFVRTRSASLLYRFVFDPSPGLNTFPAVDFCLIVASISAYQESYTLLNSSCYWFSGMVMKMVEECFTVAQRRVIMPGEAKGGGPPHPKRFSDRKAGNGQRNHVLIPGGGVIASSRSQYNPFSILFTLYSPQGGSPPPTFLESITKSDLKYNHSRNLVSLSVNVLRRNVRMEIISRLRVWHSSIAVPNQQKNRAIKKQERGEWWEKENYSRLSNTLRAGHSDDGGKRQRRQEKVPL